MELLKSLSVWETLKNTDEPIVMYGTGNGADKVFEHFSRLGIEVSGVAASDGFVRSRSFHGFTVRPISFFESELGKFTVVVTFGSQRAEIIENIKAVAKRHRVLVPTVPVVDNNIFDRNFVLENETAIREAREALFDERSNEVYDSILKFTFTGELEYLFEAETPVSEAFENILRLKSGETFVDIGAYRGDTVTRFLKYTDNKYNKILAVEPDIKSFSKLLEAHGNLRDFSAVNCAVTGVDGYVEFTSGGGRQSAVGKGEKTESRSLDTLCRGIEPTYIKIDSEGCEREILLGGKGSVSSLLPKLEIAAYHRTEDIFSLPLLIKEIAPELKIYLRHHPYIPAWDTVLYCTI